MKIVFMGTPDFARGALEALVASRHEVCLAVTQPDKSRGKGKGVTFSEVKELAVEKGIPVFQPDRVRRLENVEEIRKYNPDVIVVVAYGQILPESILEMPRFGCVNVHASILPKYRGAAPIQWAVLNGDKVTGVTTMKMDKGLDTGDIIMQREIELNEKETSGTLFDRLMAVGAELLLETLDALEDGSATFKKQDEDKATKTTLITKEMGLIDFSKDAKHIECLIRGMSPWPSAFTHYNNKMLKIFDADIVDSDLASEEDLKNADYGDVVFVDKKNFYLKTKEGLLKVNSLQLEGKKRVTSEEFLRGYQIKVGTSFR